MNYNEDWQKERKRHREDAEYNPRWETEKENRRTSISESINQSDSEKPVERNRRERSQNENAIPNMGVLNGYGIKSPDEHQAGGSIRNPNWDKSAPDTSMYEDDLDFERNERDERDDFKERNNLKEPT